MDKAELETATEIWASSLTQPVGTKPDFGPNFASIQGNVGSCLQPFILHPERPVW